MAADLTWVHWLAGLVAIGLFLYLLYALFNAEELS